jgi:hypothetical protein
MPAITSADIERRNQSRIIYASFITNQQNLNNKITVHPIQLSQSDLVTAIIGARNTSYEEQQTIFSNSPITRSLTVTTQNLPVTTQFIVSENKLASASTSGLTRINFTGIEDATPTGTGELDDAFVPIPMGGMIFNFFGMNYSNSISWCTNNAFVFGTPFDPYTISISKETGKCILIGNYDRVCASIYYSNTSGTYSITKLIINFWDYFNDTTLYTYQVRLIKENIGANRQFIEICVITSPPSPGYSSGKIYPTTENLSGRDANGNPIDSRDNIIDQTKLSPYNITNGTTFLNPCGTTFSEVSPPAGTSFIFSSDSTGTDWTFTNNSYVNV